MINRYLIDKEKQTFARIRESALHQTLISKRGTWSERHSRRTASPRSPCELNRLSTKKKLIELFTYSVSVFHLPVKGLEVAWSKRTRTIRVCRPVSELRTAFTRSMHLFLASLLTASVSQLTASSKTTATEGISKRCFASQPVLMMPLGMYRSYVFCFCRKKIEIIFVISKITTKVLPSLLPQGMYSQRGVACSRAGVDLQRG